MREPARFLVLTAEDPDGSRRVTFRKYQDGDVIEIPGDTTVQTCTVTFPLAEKVARVEAAGGGVVRIPAGEWVNVNGTLVPYGGPLHLAALEVQAAEDAALDP